MGSNDNNPFSGFDFGKFDVQKMLGDFKIPGVDMQAMMSAQEKNIAALKQANQHAAEGLQALAKRQMEMMQQVMQGAASAARARETTMAMIRRRFMLRLSYATVDE